MASLRESHWQCEVQEERLLKGKHREDDCRSSAESVIEDG